MEKIIIFSSDVEFYLAKLIDTLYEQNYFGFKEDAKSYVQEIILFVMNNDFKFNVTKTPKKLEKFGSKFLKYKANNQTTWYIFFDERDHQFLINHMMNNHSHEFPELM